MADNSSGATSVASAPAKSNDPAWAHARIVEGKRNHTVCIYCNKHIKGGGITRLKQHLAGVTGQVDPCKSVSHDVRWKFQKMLEDYKKDKERRAQVSRDIGQGPSYEGEDDEEELPFNSPSISKDKQRSTGEPFKRRRSDDDFFAPRTTKGSQPGIKSALATKEAIHQAKMSVSRWWYDAGIPFNAANSSYYQPAIDAMISIGSRFNGLSAYELHCPLLNDHVREIRDYLFHGGRLVVPS